MAPSNSLPEGFSELDVFALGSCLLVEGLLGLILNAVTVIAFLNIRNLRTPSHFLIFCLALADMGIASNATIAAFTSFLRYWPYGSDGCQTHGFHGFLTALSSLHFIAAIAWDRYSQYCTRTKLQWIHATTIAICIWLFSAFWAAMPLVGWGEYDYEPLRTCCTLDISKGDWNYVSYLIPMATSNMGIQVLIVFLSYQSIKKMFKKTGQERHLIYQTAEAKVATAMGISFLPPTLKHRHAKLVKFNCSTPLKTLLFCWSPYGILAFYAAVENANLLSPKLRMIAPIVAKTSPIFNVFVYALGNESYRGGIWQLLTGQKIEFSATENKVK